MLFSELKFKTI